MHRYISILFLLISYNLCFDINENVNFLLDLTINNMSVYDRDKTCTTQISFFLKRCSSVHVETKSSVAILSENDRKVVYRNIPLNCRVSLLNDNELLFDDEQIISNIVIKTITGEVIIDGIEYFGDVKIITNGKFLEIGLVMSLEDITKRLVSLYFNNTSNSDNYCDILMIICRSDLYKMSIFNRSVNLSWDIKNCQFIMPRESEYFLKKNMIDASSCRTLGNIVLSQIIDNFYYKTSSESRWKIIFENKNLSKMLLEYFAYVNNPNNVLNDVEQNVCFYEDAFDTSLVFGFLPSKNIIKVENIENKCVLYGCGRTLMLDFFSEYIKNNVNCLNTSVTHCIRQIIPSSRIVFMKHLIE